jgi:hypothetical protein
MAEARKGTGKGRLARREQAGGPGRCVVRVAHRHSWFGSLFALGQMVSVGADKRAGSGIRASGANCRNGEASHGASGGAESTRRQRIHPAAAVQVGQKGQIMYSITAIGGMVSESTG